LCLRLLLLLRRIQLPRQPQFSSGKDNIWICDVVCFCYFNPLKPISVRPYCYIPKIITFLNLI